MKQGTIIAVVVVVVLLGVGGYVFMSKENGVAREADMPGERMMESRSGMGSLRSLLGLGENMVCTITQEIPGEGTYSGVTYISGENLRGDFTMTVDGQAMESHMIQDGEYVYTWGETPFGSMATKFKINKDIEVDDTAVDTDSSDDSWGDAEGDMLGAEEDVEYSCESWRVDRSKFVPPSDIVFTDMDAQMDAQMNAIQGGSFNLGGEGGDVCAVCDQAPDAESKAQCKAALGCS